MSERERIIEVVGYHFAALVSGNRMPHMSGDPRSRLPAHERRRFDEACEACADAILSRPEPSEAVVGLYYVLKLCAARIERPNLSPDADVVLERARAAIAAYEGERGK